MPLQSHISWVAVFRAVPFANCWQLWQECRTQRTSITGETGPAEKLQDGKERRGIDAQYTLGSHTRTRMHTPTTVVEPATVPLSNVGRPRPVSRCIQPTSFFLVFLSHCTPVSFLGYLAGVRPTAVSTQPLHTGVPRIIFYLEIYFCISVPGKKETISLDRHKALNGLSFQEEKKNAWNICDSTRLLLSLSKATCRPDFP